MRRLTIKRNSIAVVTDGSAVLGLGNIGPMAALPVMEGKAALFKRFAGIDAWPICLDTQDTEEIIRTVKAIAPGFAGINLEDISAPRCFEIERRLREDLDIPVFHDDQHGTAIVVLAALTNALRVVGKELSAVRIVGSGAGAAGTAIIKLLLDAGAKDITVADYLGVVHSGRDDLGGVDSDLRWVAEHTNPAGYTGTLREALAGADVFIGVSAPNILTGDDIATMAPGSIVFALANPEPEVDPAAARETAAVVATGRSDYPNQINNVLAFPGFFRGLLDAQSHEIRPEMLVAAAPRAGRRGQGGRAERELHRALGLRPRGGHRGGGRRQGRGHGHQGLNSDVVGRPLRGTAGRRRGGRRSRRYGISSTLPVVARPASAVCASPACASGKRAPMVIFRLPSATAPRISPERHSSSSRDSM